VPLFAVFIYPLLALIAFLTLYPFLMVLAASFTQEKELIVHGARLVPRAFSLDAYGLLLERGAAVINAYKITLFVTVVGTIVSMALTSTVAYAISMRKLRYRNFIAFLIYFTMLFNGGLIPWYILIVRNLHLKNTIWAMILPMAVSPFYVFLMRSYFHELPESLRESAQIDGAGDLGIWWRIFIPISTPVIATVALFYSLAYWNDWYLALFFVEKSSLEPLQFHLYRILSSIQFLQSTTSQYGSVAAGKVFLPTTGVKFATTVITIGPIILVYPFVQRYFVKGIMIGAIKG
jgi:ABC-type glycerol-3-phosphate transport system permease component